MTTCINSGFILNGIRDSWRERERETEIVRKSIVSFQSIVYLQSARKFFNRIRHSWKERERERDRETEI